MTGATQRNENRQKCPRYRVLDLINTDNSAKELLDHRVAQVIATGRYENAIGCGSGPYVQRLRDCGHTVHVIDTPRGLSPPALAISIWRTYRLLRRGRFHIVHTHGSVIGVIGRAAAWLARTPVVVHQVHGFHHHENMPRFKRHLFILIERIMALATDALLFQTLVDREECARRRMAPACKLASIGNGVQLDVFRPHGEPRNRPPQILCIARFEPVKNHMMLLQAARLLKERDLDFVLTLAGDGELRASCEAWVRNNALSPTVRFVGYVDDAAALTAQAEVCVLVSVKEGVPRALMEAAACARPAVATDVAGNRDSIVDGVTGFLVPLNDPAALANRLQRLLEEPELRERMGRAALAHARRHFNEMAVCDRIIAVYDDAMAGRRRG